MKGLSYVILPYVTNGGRVVLNELTDIAMDSDYVEKKSYKDCRRELMERDITSFLNQNDFYSVGKDDNGRTIFCFIDDMTEEERMKAADKFDDTGNRYHSKADRFRNGQWYIDTETMKIVFPDPVVIGQ